MTDILHFRNPKKGILEQMFQMYTTCCATFRRLADKTQATQTNVEHKERVNRNTNAILHDARATQNADTSRQRPRDKHKVDWNPGYRWKADRT